MDYSKWNHLEDSDDEAPAPKTASTSTGRAEELPPGVPPGAKQVDLNSLPPELANDATLMKDLADRGIIGEGMTKIQATPKGSEKGRHAFQHEGQTIYEWEQTLDEVNIWIKPPPGVTAQHLDIQIAHMQLRVGIQGNPPFLEQSTGGAVLVSESFWSLDRSECEVTINLQKMRKGEMWQAALAGHGELDPLSKEEDKKRLMLERFAEENPGFDFSNADFNGSVPDARSFMGGVKYS